MRAERLGLAALLALPGALTVYFGFTAGGFFPAQPAIVAVFLALVLVVRVTSAEQPFAGLGPALGFVAGVFALYALWTLLSSIWSHATGRALIEFDRALMYLLTLLLFGSVARTTERLRWMVRGLAVGIVVVCACGLVTRLLPHLWPTSPNIANNRLSYPVTYWNSLGLLAALGNIFCLHLTSSRRERQVVRVVAAACIPLLSLTLYFTFSRGAIAAGLLGIVAYLVVARSRSAVVALLAVAVPTAVAVWVAYGAEALASFHPVSAPGVAQGHEVALVGVVCSLAAVCARLALTPLETRLLSLRIPARVRRFRWAALTTLSATIIVAALAVGLPAAVGRQFDRFVQGRAPALHGDLRNRLTDAANNGRTDLWKATFAEFRSSPLVGDGAGTYQLAWERRRPRFGYVKDAHSLYFEVLGELGAVGLVLLLIAILSFLLVPARAARGKGRGIYAVIFAASLAWALSAGLDWDWEMPVVSLWVFALGGAVLARPGHPAASDRPSPHNTVRVVVAVGWLAAALTPALVAVSEGHLGRGLAAFDQGDCQTASREAFSAIATVGAQPRPYELIGYCDLDRGAPRAAMAAMRAAVDRDPDNWQYRYDLAAALAAAGLDPRREAAHARALDPFEDATREAAALYRAGNPAQWPQAAETARDLIVRSGRVARY